MRGPCGRKVEPLSKLHDRDGFDGGSEPLNVILKLSAIEAMMQES
jgi:hypothetical protein